jgi:glycosyltransferase involved in cell wall biosynthesis
MVCVIVPSFGRAAHLERCLNALADQERPADNVAVVHRPDDDRTVALVESWMDRGVAGVSVDHPGQLEALRAGIRKTTEDIVGFTDDDARPHSDWVSRILEHFRDPTIGGVGGRDRIIGMDGPSKEPVGRITVWGKLIGNHHLGHGPPREVDVLKGVNMAFRREALTLPDRLRGSGAQPHNEVSVCLWAQRAGWRLVYDPAIVVEHDLAPRVEDDERDAPTGSAIRDSSYNLVVSVLSARPELVRRRTAYGLLVGDRGNPGVARAGYALLAGDLRTVRSLPPALLGQIGALADVLRGRALLQDRSLVVSRQSRQTNPHSSVGRKS